MAEEYRKAAESAGHKVTRGIEDTGIVTAKIDEQKTDGTRAKILQIVEKL